MKIKIKRFKLIKCYPFSPELGTYLSSIDSKSITIKPELYPEFWEKIKNENLICKTKDGFDLYEGDIFFKVNIQNLKIENLYLSNIISNCETIFKLQENAIKFLESLIDIQLVDTKIVGENVKLYSVLTKANWQIGETNSLDLYRKLIGKVSPNWRYFRTEKERKEFIIMNKPVFSIKDINHLLNNPKQCTIEEKFAELESRRI